MQLAPSDEQSMLRDMVRRFLADHLDATTMAKAPIARAAWIALGKLGLFAFLLPERGGGMGGSPADAMIVAEELGRGLAITSLAESVLLCAGLVARHGTEEQIARWVAPVAEGEMTLAFVQGGNARQDGDTWKLRGKGGLVRDGMAAGAFLVAVPGSPPLLVVADAPGVLRKPVRLVDGSIAADLLFEDAPGDAIDASSRDIAVAISDAELAVVAEMVGMMSTLLDLTVDYVKQRHQFGKPIGSFQVVQHRGARLFIALEQSRSMLLKAALAEAQVRSRAITAAKAYVADVALRFAEDAVQLHGGMGVTEELAVGRALRRMLLLSRTFGGASAARLALIS